jgi:ferredoxin
MRMLKGMLDKLEDRLLGSRTRGAEADRLEGVIRDLDAALGDLRKELKVMRSRLDALEARLPAPKEHPATSTASPRRSEAPASLAAPADQTSSASPKKGRGSRKTATVVADPPRRYIRINEDDCIMCGTCVSVAESVFAMPIGQKAKVISQDAPVALIQEAIDLCPVACILWSDTP